MIVVYGACYWLSRQLPVRGRCVFRTWLPHRSGRKRGKKRKCKWKWDGRRSPCMGRAPTFACGTSETKCWRLTTGGRKVLLKMSRISSRPPVDAALQVLEGVAAAPAASSRDIALAFHLSRLPSPPRITRTYMLHSNMALHVQLKYFSIMLLQYIHIILLLG